MFPLGSGHHDSAADLYRWATDLFPIARSITGEGTRQTLNYVKNLLPDLKIHEIKSGKTVLDWTIPKEWNIKTAYIKDQSGNKVVDFAENNLHVVGYSKPVDIVLSRDELEQHLYSLPLKPNWVPYVTSYYKESWGFCLSEEQRCNLGNGPFHVYIDATIQSGSMSYADLVIKGSSKKEILFTTYVCHPSMANNELSGPIVAIALARWIASQPNRKYTYRFVFAPETIGAITYIAQKRRRLKRRTYAAWVLTCMGDDRTYSYLPPRIQGSPVDIISRKVLKDLKLSFEEYSFLDRGSDERQYSWPGVDLPIASIMRSKYHTYPEYHTSADDLDFISESGLDGSLTVMKNCISYLENNLTPKSTTYGEPNLGKRDLYPLINKVNQRAATPDLLNFLIYSDGHSNLWEISESIGLTFDETLLLYKSAELHGLAKRNKRGK